jgi:ABC-2 type transport system permease protein
MLFSSLILWAKEVNASVNLVRGIIMILCGITFPISVMPGWMQSAAKIVPFTYGISAIRQIMVNGSSLAAASYNISMCLLGGIVFLIAGKITFSWIEGKVKNSGSLERF